MHPMTPRIETLKEKKLIGKRLKMSLTKNRTGELWSGFSPEIKRIQNPCNNEKISMQIYGSGYFEQFNPDDEFEKWASIEVKDFNNIPKGLESFLLKAGLYAIFYYRGPGNDRAVFHYIFTEWLPNSGYLLDKRPHFEILGDKYKNNDPDSEEEIWIPVRKKP